ncbi:ATP-dependent sacrificial sulfur transferase LarE [Silvibacterium acidisoli]|uniref:ATP-dependent sacrificial sulfur transferase LarE n=1 Tax=Acidobacteriaceae bacterium ZG23-2 TaxID=2883246 RepID=UPI00406D0A5D
MSEVATTNTGADPGAGQARLDECIRRLGSVIIAYSGGIDSAYLAWSASRVLGEKAVAIIADSASLPRSHYRDAIAFAEGQGIAVRTVKTAELEREAYAVNDANRCFHCKDELFDTLEKEREAIGFDAVAYGLNLDDRKDFRPGQRAAVAHRIAAPLAEAGLTKADVRALAREAGLEIWDKPASACLSSRIEYGRRVTPENLKMVEDAEEGLRLLGLRNFRVRHHGAVARIEIAESEMASVLDPAKMRQISVEVKAAGFQYVAIDCDGYRSGSMNEILPVEVLLRAGA